jgi:hypothetical protein
MMNALLFTLKLSGPAGSFPRPLKAEEEREYLQRAEQGDLEARNILVEHNLRLVAHIVKKVYSFSDLEKEAAPLLYKCIRPLWWHASLELEEAGTNDAKVQRHLDAIEYEQTRDIDFSRHM